MSETAGYCKACGSHNDLHDKDCLYHPKRRPTYIDEEGVQRVAMTEYEQRVFSRGDQTMDEQTRRFCFMTVLQFMMNTQRQPGDVPQIDDMIREAKKIFDWEMKGEVPAQAGEIHNLRQVN